MKKNFSRFLFHTAMFELSCDPMLSKMFRNDKKALSK